MQSSIDDSTLERLVPDRVEQDDVTGKETLKLHMERYVFAASHIPPGARVLDIACGVGYGSKIIHERMPSTDLTGVDLSADAIQYALKRYGRNRIAFVADDAMTFTAAPFDVVVSLETIEHLPDPDAFVRRVAQTLLKPGGLFVGSVPVTPSMDANPHHLSDFTPRSFRQLLARYGLSEIGALPQVQPFSAVSVAKRTEKRMQGMRQNLLGYYLTHPGKALLRMRSTLIDGFNNKYLTLACRKS